MIVHGATVPNAGRITQWPRQRDHGWWSVAASVVRIIKWHLCADV
jgi:hypothetical protein